MKNLYILLIAVLLSYTAQAQLGTDIFSVGSDDASNYNGTWVNPNSGNGFSDWVFDTSGTDVGFAGRFIGSFSEALDVSGDSFALYANSNVGAFSGATTTMPKSLEEGDSFTVSVGVNYRDGNKGFDLRDSSDNNIINFNVGGDVYNIAGTSLYENTYDANTVITFKFTQGATNVLWTADRTGGLTATQSGTIANISPGTIYDIRFYNASAGTNNDGGAGQRNLYINSLEFSSLYTITENSIVASSGDITVPYLDIQSGSTLNIPSNSSVTVSGNLNNSGMLTLTSTSTVYPSLIPNTVSGNGTTIYNRFTNATPAELSTTGGNDLISAPLTGQAFDAFIAANPNILADENSNRVLFGPFITTTNAFELWEEDNTTVLTPGIGYRAGTSTNPGSNVIYEGTVNTGNVNVGISEGTGSRFNLIGNPYPSYLDAETFYAENKLVMDPNARAIYGYSDGTNESGLYTILNNFNISGYELAPGQGFFVAASDTPGDVLFKPDMRRTASTDDFILGKNAAVITNLKLKLNTDTQEYLTDIYFSEFSSLGLDPGYDASSFGGSTSGFSIYSHLVEENEGIPFAIQAVGETDYNDVTIPLGVKSSQGVQVTFSIFESNVPETVDVFLDDTVENTSTLLTQANYVLTPSVNLTGVGRFYLRFAGENLSTNYNAFLNGLTVIMANNTRELIVKGQLSSATTCEFYDVQGRLISRYGLDRQQTENRIAVSNLNSGIYIIKIKDQKQENAMKVIID